MKKSTIKFLATFVFMTVISFAVKAQTNVSGGIYYNTTWTKANSPYIVKSNIVVFPGITLSIEPGVRVMFADSVGLEFRQANLFAVGTITDSITFTSNSNKPVAGSWGGITIGTGSGDTSKAKISYCNFKFGAAYLTGNNSVLFTVLSYNTIKNPFIKHCSFYNNGGLEDASGAISSSNFTITITVDSCLFVNNNIGVCSDDNNPCNFIVTNSLFNNNYYGCYLLEGGNIDNCIFYRNNSAIQGGDKISNCTFFYNQYGINSGSPKIINCIIDSNKIIGIAVENDSIVNCNIRYNGIGLQSEGSTITKNIIENNSIGIKSLGSDKIYCNKLCNNTSYDFYFDSKSNMSITDNYWCTTDSATIASHIYDGYENINLGIVKFMPIDTTQCYQTGCNLQLTASVVNTTCDTCHNGSATANVINGTAPYTYTWNTTPVQTNQTAIGLTYGTYSVCVTDSKGCSVCKNDIFIDSTRCKGLKFSTNSYNATCSSCPDGYAWINKSIQGGTPPFTFTWYTNPLQTSDTARGMTPGTYLVCVRDFNGCATCDSITVKTADCSAQFDLYFTSTPHVYNAVNEASGVKPLKYLWSWGDGKYDSTAYPSHTYDSTGFYKICLTITDAVGCTSTYCNAFYLMKSDNPMITVNVIPYVSTGITENFNYRSFYIFPNPSSDFITIQTQNNTPQSYIVTLRNIQGQVVLMENINNSLTHILNISGLNNGIYILSLQNEKENYVKKIVVQK